MSLKKIYTSVVFAFKTMLLSAFNDIIKVKGRSFRGGYYFKRFEGEPGAEIILPASMPSQVIIPLKQGFGREVPVLVNRGDRVKAGQIIGRDDETISSPIHASVNGTVESIKRIEYFGEKIRFVSILPDGSSGWQPLEGHSAQWSQLSVSHIEELLYLSGVTALGSSGIPTRYKSSIISPAEVEHIIVHHTESDMFNVSLPLLLKKDGIDHFVEGLLILKRVMENAKIHLALSYPLVKQLYDFRDRLKDRPDVFYYTVKPKYPQHLDGVLIPTLLKKKLPYGNLPANIGILTLSVQDVLHVYDAVVNGRPLIEKLVVLTGPGFEQRPNLLVKIGTPLQEIIASRVRQDKELRFVLNSLVTGKTIENLNSPVCRDYHQIISVPERKEGEILSFIHPGLKKDSYSNTFLSFFLPLLPLLPSYLQEFCWIKKRFTTNINGEKRGCLSCGFCSNCCPARLYPNLLHHYIEREKFDEPPVQYGIFDCIDCNLCTYVCPSKIPVAELLKFGKKKLVEEGFHPYEQESFADLQEIDEYRGLP